MVLAGLTLTLGCSGVVSKVGGDARAKVNCPHLDSVMATAGPLEVVQGDVPPPLIPGLRNVVATILPPAPSHPDPRSYDNPSLALPHPDHPTLVVTGETSLSAYDMKEEFEQVVTSRGFGSDSSERIGEDNGELVTFSQSYRGGGIAGIAHSLDCPGRPRRLVVTQRANPPA